MSTISPAVDAAGGDGLFRTPIANGTSLSLRAVVGVVCSLSMLGASLIVLLFLLVPRLRTKPVLILVHISLMDFITAAANLTGVVLVTTGSNHGPGCVAQASVAMYGTLSSVLWTSGLAVYVFAVVVFGEQKIGLKIHRCLFALCYGLPLLMTLWFSLTDKLGPDPIGGPSWCSLVLHDSAGRRVPFNELFGSDLWMYISLVIVLVLFIPMHCYLKYLHDEGPGVEPQQSISAELKLLSIPVVFLILRVWSLVLGMTEVEIGYDLNDATTNALLYMSGIGDSAQGFANSVIFILFTPDVRMIAVRLCRSMWCSGYLIRPPSDSVRVDSTSLTYEESQLVSSQLDNHNINPARSILVKT